MTREQVRQIAGPASTEITMVHARGTCQTYVIGERDGKQQTYFVRTPIRKPRSNGSRITNGPSQTGRFLCAYSPYGRGTQCSCR